MGTIGCNILKGKSWKEKKRVNKGNKSGFSFGKKCIIVSIILPMTLRVS